jgi:hypothetical protein
MPNPSPFQHRAPDLLSVVQAQAARGRVARVGALPTGPAPGRADQIGCVAQDRPPVAPPRIETGPIQARGSTHDTPTRLRAADTTSRRWPSERVSPGPDRAGRRAATLPQGAWWSNLPGPLSLSMDGVSHRRRGVAGSRPFLFLVRGLRLRSDSGAQPEAPRPQAEGQREGSVEIHGGPERVPVIRSSEK